MCLTMTSCLGVDPEFGGIHFAEKQKKKKGDNGCPLPNVYTIKYIKILIQIFIHSFTVDHELHCLMNTVTALM